LIFLDQDNLADLQIFRFNFSKTTLLRQNIDRLLVSELIAFLPYIIFVGFSAHAERDNYD